MTDRKIYKELLRRAKEIEKEDDVAIVMINVSITNSSIISITNSSISKK